MAKFILPKPPALVVSCRSCGEQRPTDEFRIFQAKPTKLHMDFCVHCEKRDGTLTLYRRYNAYGTPAIIEAVLAAAKTPPARRTPDQARLLVEAKPDREPATNEEVLQREMARRELCRRRLVYFATTMDRTYKPGWVHQDVCRRLERFVAQVEAGLSPRLMLAMPPRAGKSRLASDIAVSWILGKHPEWPVIGASYAQSLPIEFSRNIRDRLSDPEYRSVFPDTTIRADAKAVEQWRTSKGGGYKTAGVGVGLTGFGGMVMVADDLIKDAAEANSETVRKNTFDWYQSVFRTRLAPGGGILMIGTRWHHDDPAGRLLTIEAELRKAGVPDYELENWEVVSYPALAEHDEYLMMDGSIGYDITEEERPKVVRKLRNHGEALHPERYPVQELMKIKRNMTTSMWSALYQQNPTPDEGDFFMRDDFKFRWLDPAYRPLCRVFMTADYAIGKKERNDFTVLAVFALDSNDDLYVLEVRRGRWGTLEIAQNAAALAERHKVEVYAGEQGSIHHAVWPIIKQELDKKRIYPSVDDSLTPIQDKETRARPLQGRMQRRKLFFSFDEREKPEIYDIAEREMLQFPNAANDDIVDALAWGARLALNLSLPTSKAPPKQKSWKDDLDATMTGASNFMAA